MSTSSLRPASTADSAHNGRPSTVRPAEMPATSPLAPGAREDAARRLADQEKRLAALQERRRMAEETAAREEAMLARLTTEAEERFGTADPDELEAIEARALEEFSRQVEAFTAALDDAERRLAEIEREAGA